MKTDAELEALLRRTLDERAAEVRESASFTEPTGTRRIIGRPWLPMLAAAAAVALVTGGVVLGVQLTGSHHATHPSPPAPQVAVTKSCSISLPSVWRSAIRHGASRFGAVSAMQIGISPDGRSVLVARDFGTARDVALVDASGTARRIYAVPRPNLNQVQRASIDGNYAVIDLQRLPRNANGVIGTDVAVVLVDLRTGRARNLDAVTVRDIHDGGRTIDGSWIVGAQVYWDVHSPYGSHRGVVKDYDVATGQVRIVYRGSVGLPVMTSLGLSVTWGDQGHLVITRPLPAPVERVLTSQEQRTSLVDDGSSYAWIDGSRIAWWGPGHTQVTEVNLPRGEQPGLVAVGGNFVLYTDQASPNPVAAVQVLDVRTGATGPAAGLQPYALSSHGVVVPYRFVAGFKESPTEPVRIDTTRLPGLHC